jgi:hypothetical protein
MNITAQLDRLSTAEKISTMEYLWDDLCRHAEQVVSPVWHGEVLARRASSVADANSNSTFRDWETEKARIRTHLTQT